MPLLADARGEAGEVAVRGDEAEAVEAAGVQQVHRVDDQRDVGRVLAGGVGELLLRQDGVPGQHLLPAGLLALGEVAVDAAQARLADLGHLLEEAVGDLGRGVVGVDQDGELAARRPRPSAQPLRAARRWRSRPGVRPSLAWKARMAAMVSGPITPSVGAGVVAAGDQPLLQLDLLGARQLALAARPGALRTGRRP